MELNSEHLRDIIVCFLISIPICITVPIIYRIVYYKESK